MGVMRSGLAGLAWGVLSLCAVAASNFAVSKAKERRWQAMAGWLLVSAGLFGFIFFSIPIVWAFTCTP